MNYIDTLKTINTTELKTQMLDAATDATDTYIKDVLKGEDAFAQDMHLELCHTLKILAIKIRDYDNVVRSATVRDTKGNKIGTWEIKGE